MRSYLFSFALLILLHTCLATSQEAPPNEQKDATKYNRLDERFKNADKPSADDYDAAAKKTWKCNLTLPKAEDDLHFSASFDRDSEGDLRITLSNAPDSFGFLQNSHYLNTDRQFSDFALLKSDREEAQSVHQVDTKPYIQAPRWYRYEYTLFEHIDKKYAVCIRRDGDKFRMEINTDWDHRYDRRVRSANSEIDQVRNGIPTETTKLLEKYWTFLRSERRSSCFEYWKQLGQAVCEVGRR